MNLVSLACFLILLFRVPARHGNVDEGVYNVFLTLSLPLLVYHATSTNLDLPLVIPFVLGFLFFSIYVENGKTSDLNTAILLFTVAALIKNKGDILAVTGIGIAIIFILLESARRKSAIPWKSILFLLPLATFLYLKGSLSPSGFNRLQSPVRNFVDYFGRNLNEAEVAVSGFAPGMKVYGFFHSMFLSGHFNLLFYLLIVSILFFSTRIYVSKRLKWSLFFFCVVFSECFFYMAIRWDRMLDHQSIIHRVMLLLAVTGALFLSSIWARGKSRSDSS